MAKLKMPSVIVAFNEKGASAIERSERGIVLVILEEKNKSMTADSLTIYTIDDIPEDLSDFNKEQIKLALQGYQLTPRKVLVYFIAPVEIPETPAAPAPPANTSNENEDEDSGTNVADSSNEESEIPEQDYTQILKVIENVKFTYLAIPALPASKVTDIATWIKGMRSTKGIMVKAVLPNCAADNEGVINFTNSLIRTATKTYTAAEYCSRVAGILAGTPLTIAATYAPAGEIIEVEAQTKDELDTRVGNGEFFFYNDGEKIKVARGVNSFVTTIGGKGDSFKKIKIIEILDMIKTDITETFSNYYIGKYANNASNRAILITAINGYFKTLETEGLLENGDNRAYIDIEAVKNWRQSNGLNTREELDSMNEDAIKKLNLHSSVFLAADISVLDAIEEITLNIAL